TFDQWKIKPKGIYYTSALSLDAPHNQIELVKKELFNLMSHGEVMNDRVDIATEQIVEAHKTELETDAENTLVQFAADNLEDFDVHEFRQIQDNLNELSEVIPNLKAEYDEELHLTL